MAGYLYIQMKSNSSKQVARILCICVVVDVDVRVVNVGRPALCPFSLSHAGTFWPVLTGSSHTCSF